MATISTSCTRTARAGNPRQHLDTYMSRSLIGSTPCIPYIPYSPHIPSIRTGWKNRSLHSAFGFQSGSSTPTHSHSLSDVVWHPPPPIGVLGVETGGSGQSCAEQLSAARNQLIVESTATCINPLMAHGGGGAVLRMSPLLCRQKTFSRGKPYQTLGKYIFFHTYLSCIILKKKISFLDRWLDIYQEIQNQFHIAVRISAQI